MEVEYPPRMQALFPPCCYTLELYYIAKGSFGVRFSCSLLFPLQVSFNIHVFFKTKTTQTHSDLLLEALQQVVHKCSVLPYRFSCYGGQAGQMVRFVVCDSYWLGPCRRQIITITAKLGQSLLASSQKTSLPGRRNEHG